MGEGEGGGEGQAWVVGRTCVAVVVGDGHVTVMPVSHVVAVPLAARARVSSGRWVRVAGGGRWLVRGQPMGGNSQHGEG